MNKKLIYIAVMASVISFNVSNPTFAQQYGLESGQSAYEQGNTYLGANQYTEAIKQLTFALKNEPNNIQVRNDLAQAYYKRGTYYFNSGINLDKAANDFRAVLFYEKYYSAGLIVDPSMQEIVASSESNLQSISGSLKENTLPEGHYKKALELRGQGDFIQAVTEYNLAIASDKYKSKSFEALGDLMKVMGNNSSSAAYYDNALKADSKDPMLHLKFARMLELLGNSVDAAKEYNVALSSGVNTEDIVPALEKIWRDKVSQNPNDADAHSNLGAVLQKKGDFNAALAEYQISESLEPQNISTRINIGTLYQAKGDFNTAIQAYDSVLASYPGNLTVHNYKAKALADSGSYEPAIKELQVIISADPSNEQAKQDLVNILMNKVPPTQGLDYMYAIANEMPDDEYIQFSFGVMLQKNKKLDDAIPYYQRVIQLNNKNVDAYVRLAQIFNTTNKQQELCELFQKAKEALPDNDELKNLQVQIENEQMAQSYKSGTQKYDKADYQGALNDFLSIKNPNEDVLFSIAACYQELDQYDKAIEFYNKILVINPKNSNALFYIGTVYQAKNDTANAEGFYNKALKLDPNNKNAKNALNVMRDARIDKMIDKGMDLYNEKKYREALLEFNKVVSLNSQHAYAHYYKGMVYDALQNYSLAIASYKKAVSLTKDLNMAYYSMGLDYDSLSNKTEALNAYKAFIAGSKNAQDDYTKYAKKRIKELGGNATTKTIKK